MKCKHRWKVDSEGEIVQNARLLRVFAEAINHHYVHLVLFLVDTSLMSLSSNKIKPNKDFTLHTEKEVVKFLLFPGFPFDAKEDAFDIAWLTTRHHVYILSLHSWDS